MQTADGDGALIQPILAYGYTGSHYSIFNACFDWTDGSWTTSKEVYTVPAGDLITSSTTYDANSRSYRMIISSQALGKTITTDYALKSKQTKPESTVYFVLEHQPSDCRAYPASGVATFENIHVEVAGELLTQVPWEAKDERPKCDSATEIVDSQTIRFTWDPSDDKEGTAPTEVKAPPKWGFLPRRPPAARLATVEQLEREA